MTNDLAEYGLGINHRSNYDTVIVCLGIQFGQEVWGSFLLWQVVLINIDYVPKATY